MNRVASLVLLSLSTLILPQLAIPQTLTPPESGTKDALWRARSSQNSQTIQDALDAFDARLSSIKRVKTWGIGSFICDQMSEGLDRIEGKLWDIKLKATPNKEINWKEWTDAVAFAKTMKSKRPSLDVSQINPEMLEPNDYPDGNWTFIGPKGFEGTANGFGTGPVTGRIGAIGISNQAPDSKWYVAGAQGGLWKTTNGGTTWTALSEDWDGLAISSIAIDPANDDVVYVGTGDFDDANRVSFGMMKTSNGGQTWTNIGQSSFRDGNVNAIILDPDRPGVVYASCFGDAESHGIWRSDSGGLFWLREHTVPIRKFSLSLPNNGARYLWASPIVSQGFYRRYTGPTSSWVTVPYNSYSKLGACSKIDPNVFYVIDQDNGQVAKTTTNGNNWNDVTSDLPTTSSSFWSQVGYDFTFETGISAQGLDLLSVGLVEHWVSRNAGANFSKVSGYGIGDVHVDFHVTAMHPTNNNVFFLGSDGGFYKMTYNPTFLAWDATSYNGNFQTGGNGGFTMFYSLATHPTAPSEVMGGTQDNGVPHARGNTSDWQLIHGADGTGTAISPANPLLQYSTIQRAGWSLNAQNQEVYRIRRSTDGNQTNNVFEFPAFDEPPFVPVFHVSNEALPKLYFGSDYLHRLDELSNGLAFATTKVGNFNYEDPITAIATAPSNPSIVYVGTLDGKIFRCTSYGAFPTLIEDFLVYGRPITCISVDPSNANSILVTISGTVSQFSGRVYQCTNTTASTPVFTNIGSGLPDIWTWWIERDPWQPSTTWYVGNEIGVFYTENAGADWYDMTQEYGLPRAAVRQLSAEPATNRLYAATYGRGMFRMFIANTRPALTSVTYLNSDTNGGSTTPLRVTFNQLTPPQGLNVTLSHSPSTAVQSPTSYTIPAGVTSHDIPVRMAVLNNSVTVTTTVSGQFGGSFADSIFVNNVRLSNFTISPSIVVGSFNSTGTVFLNTVAPSGGAEVSLQTLNSGVATVPPSVTVPQGQTSAQFTITTVPSNANQTGEIFAQLGSGLFRTINTTALAISSVTVNPTSVTGGFSFNGAVNLPSPAGQAGVTVTLSSNQPSVVVPASVTIPSGASTATFVGHTALIPGPSNVTATITATQGIFFTRSTNLTVIPVAVTSVTVPKRVTVGSAFNVTVTVDRAVPPGGLDVQLTSSNPRAVTFTPAVITIPGGATSATARVGRARNVSGPVTLTAAYGASQQTTKMEVRRAP